jgi:MoaA/NifB/PqqE/SkfB family radical SAM enzyme
MSHQQPVHLNIEASGDAPRVVAHPPPAKRRRVLRDQDWLAAQQEELGQRDRWPAADQARVPVPAPRARFRREVSGGFAYSVYNAQPSYLEDFELRVLTLINGERSVDEMASSLEPAERERLRPALDRLIDLNLLRWSEIRKPGRPVKIESLLPDSPSPRGRPSAPLVVHWEPTLRCNLFCSTCYNESGPKAPVGVGAPMAVPQLIESGAFLVTILGGEPMIDPHFYSSIQALESAGLGVEFVTNGWLLTDEHLQKLLDTRICQMMVSVDGPEEIHDRVRGRKNSFRRAIEGVRRFSAAGFDVTVSLTVLRSNLSTLEYMIDLCAEVGAAYLKLRPVVDSGRAKEEVEDSEALSPEDVRAYQPLLHRKLEEYGGRLKFIHVSPAPRVGACFCATDVSDTKFRTCAGGPCFIGRKLAYLRHDGGVAAHAFVREHVVGNITESSLRAIWQHEDSWATVCP